MRKFFGESYFIVIATIITGIATILSALISLSPAFLEDLGIIIASPSTIISPSPDVQATTEAEATLTASAGDDDLLIYTTDELFILQFTGDNTVSIDELSIETTSATGANLSQPLKVFSVFSLLPLSQFPTPACLIIKIEETNPGYPGSCSAVFTQTISASDAFWIDPNTNDLRSFAIAINDITFGLCDNSRVCVIDLPSNMFFTSDDVVTISYNQSNMFIYVKASPQQSLTLADFTISGIRVDNSVSVTLGTIYSMQDISDIDEPTCFVVRIIDRNPNLIGAPIFCNSSNARFSIPLDLSAVPWIDSINASVLGAIRLSFDGTDYQCNLVDTPCSITINSEE